MKIIEDKKIYSNFKRKKSIRDFIISLHEGKLLWKSKTFKDKDKSLVQCKEYCNRSLSDTYYITKTIYKSLSVSKFLKIYNSILFKEKIDGRCVTIYYCNDVHKYVLVYSSRDPKDSNRAFNQSSFSISRYNSDLKNNNHCIDGFTEEFLSKYIKTI